MSGRNKYWKLGLFVSAGMAVGVGALLWLGASTLYQTRLRRHVLFDESVNGLEIGSPTKARGVVIGTVSGIRFASDRHTVIVDVDLFEEALISAGLEPDAERSAPDDFAVQLASTGLTGGKYLAADTFDPIRFPRVPLPERLPDDVAINDVLPSVSSSLKNFEDAVYELAETLPTMFGDVRQLVDRLTRLSESADSLAQGEAKELLATLVADVHALDLGQLSKRVGQAFDELNPTLASLRGAADSVSAEDGAIATLAADVKQLVVALTDTLAAVDAPATATALRGTLDAAGETAAEVSALSRDARGVSGELRLTLTELRHVLDDLGGLLELLELESGALVRGRHAPDDDESTP